MGASGPGPFDNDSALDFVDEFLDVESPIRSVRAALACLDEPCYHQVDDVYRAWAACELVAIVSVSGDGYDADDLHYEAAARLRPNTKLVDQCLKTLAHILGENSELSDLVDTKQRTQVEASLHQTEARLRHGLTLKKFPRLKVPRIKAMQAYAVAAGGKWLVALYDYSNLMVLDVFYEQVPESADDIPMDDTAVLFNCRYLGAMDKFTALGRLRPAEALTDSNVYVTIIRHSCSSASDMADFETNYWLNRGRQFTQHRYDDVRELPFCPEIFPEQFFALIESYVTGGKLQLPSVPTPAQLRAEFVEGCQREWAQYLEGDGGGPFSFPHLYATDVSFYLLFWIKLRLRENWTNGGMCLPDDLLCYFLAGIVAASIGAYEQDKVPKSLIPVLETVRTQIGRAEICGAIHVLSCVLDDTSVIPTVLLDDPPRRIAFLNQAGSLRDALVAALPD